MKLTEEQKQKIFQLSSSTKGLSNCEIARRIGISERTVRYHLAKNQDVSKSDRNMNQNEPKNAEMKQKDTILEKIDQNTAGYEHLPFSPTVAGNISGSSLAIVPGSGMSAEQWKNYSKEVAKNQTYKHSAFCVSPLPAFDASSKDFLQVRSWRRR